MNRLFLVALACAANIYMQAHSSQPRTQQLPREVIQELRQKQQINTTSQPAPENVPSKKMIALKITGGAVLIAAGATTAAMSTLAVCIRLSKNLSVNPASFASIASGLVTLYQAKQLFSGAYNDMTARKEAIAQLKASQQNA